MKLCKIILFATTLCFSFAHASEEFEAKLLETAQKVPEFVWIQKKAQRHGLKIWLFGGSASSFAHYVKELIAFENGSREYYAESFARDKDGNLDYTDIFRPTQDMDLVADGPIKKIREFERALTGRYPHLKGSKQRWEVRSLRENYQDKMALLNNFNFRRQHTDSHSVGLVSLDPKDKQPVKDLFDWDSSKPKFLKDVLEGKLNFYYSEKHKETQRYREGKNPPIFAVIRYFIKLFQHELEPRPEDLTKIKEIINQTRWAQDQYVLNWLNNNVPKLFLHARNVEYAAKVLEETGLKNKLLKLKGKAKIWANKEPLRSYPLGKGKGETAEQLGIKTVAHDTRDFFTWTVITRSRKGEPNVLISRKNTPEENAAKGNGFYTIKNRRQGHGNGFSIRFDMNPEAREGSDFKIYDNIVLVLNRNAIRVIPESITIHSLLDYFKLIAEEAYHDWGDGLREKLKRKLQYRYFKENKEEIPEIIKLLKEYDEEVLWREWFSFKFSPKYPEVLTFLKNNPNSSFFFIFKDVLSWPHWHRHRRKSAMEFIQKASPELLEAIIWRNVFTQPPWNKYPDLLKQVIKKANQDTLHFIVSNIFSERRWSKYPKLFEQVIQRANQQTLLVSTTTLSYPHWGPYPQLIEKVIKRGGTEVLRRLAEHTLKRDHWSAYPRLLELMIDTGNVSALSDLAGHALRNPGWRKYPRLIQRLINLNEIAVNYNLAIYAFSTTDWSDHPELVEPLMNEKLTLSRLIMYTLSRPGWNKHPYLVERIIAKENPDYLKDVVSYILSQPHWADHPYLVEMVILRGDGEVLRKLAKHVLSRKHWKYHPRLVELARGQKVTAKNLKSFLGKGCL